MEQQLIRKEVCPKHGLTDFYYCKSENRWRCKECRKDAVIDKRRRNKIELVKYKGGKCEICGYDRCIDALEFHHLNPETKSFGIGNGDVRSLKRLKEEVDKCIMVCSNCHKELHAKIRQDKEMSKQTEIEKNVESFIDSNMKAGVHIFLKPTEKDIEKIKSLIDNGESSTKIAKSLNFSLTTLKRFMKKNNIVNTNYRTSTDH